MIGSELTALEYIGRNGNLVGAVASGYEAVELFDSLKDQGLIERNVWSSRWMLTDKGRYELKTITGKTAGGRPWHAS